MVKHPNILLAVGDPVAFWIFTVATVAACAVFVFWGYRTFSRRPWFALGVQFSVGLITAAFIWATEEFKPTGTDELSVVFAPVLLFDCWLFLLTLLFSVVPHIAEKRRLAKERSATDDKQNNEQD